MSGVVHVRRKGPRRSPHRAGRITPENVLDADPRGRTLCGAPPTSNDVSFHTAERNIASHWVTCPACIEVVS